MKKILSVILSFAMIISFTLPVGAEQTLSDDIVILYTNDVHTYIDGDLSYDTVAAIKKDLQKKYKYVFLADAGDHIQGTAYGSLDKGEGIIKMMNTAGYDVATLGNHEFDYGTDGCLNAVALAKYPYVSANFYNVKNGTRTDNVLDDYVLFECGDEKIAFVGITTPETFEKSTSAYFKDENGNFIYGISGGKDGSEICTDVQNAIDTAKEDGATKVIALGHLGTDTSSKPWTSTETINGVSGLDAFIDGHSHSTVRGENIKDKDGKNVVLTQTGSYFERIGIMVIDSDTDKISTDFIECEDVLDNDGKTVTGQKLVSGLYSGTELLSDDDVRKIKDSKINEIDEKLGEKIGFSNVVLDNYDEDENRLVRFAETNSGDFAADALYWFFDNAGMDVDAAIMNGGGIRNTAIKGDISYKTCKDIHTFGNVACLQRVNGKQILDALEWGARQVGTGENGGFLQVSGITYKIDTTVPNTVKEDEIGTWIAGPEKYRVYDVMIYNRKSNEYEPLDENAKYNLAGYNYTLRNLGDGYAMFAGAVNILDYAAEDYMVLADYIKGFENGVVDTSNSPLKEKYPSMLLDYGTVNGSGRIEITETPRQEVIYIGGVEVTEKNSDDVLGDGGSVKYDASSCTLLLTDAEISNDSGHGIYSYGINLTIKGIDTDADGSNSISAKNGCAIYVEGNGQGGNGYLVTDGQLGDISAVGGYGMVAYEDVTIKGTIGNIYSSGDLNSGILSWFGNVIAENNAVTGDVYSEDYDGITAAHDIIISGTISDIYGGGYAGIRSTGGDVHITGTVRDITGLAGGIEAYMSENGGGNVDLSGMTGRISGESAGVYAEGYINISGTAELSVSGTESVYALSAGEGIILPDKFDIVDEPKEYSIKSCKDESLAQRYTISEKDGTVARYVKFIGFVNPYADIDSRDWFYPNVLYVTANNLMNGISETEFAPNGSLTRAMLVTILWRAEKEPESDGAIPFEDIAPESYYAEAVRWATDTGMIKGVNETEFAPDSNITREQTAEIIYRYAKHKEYDITQGGMQLREFDDFENISEYAVNAMNWMINTGLMNGKTDRTLNPKDGTTRAETAALLNRFLTFIG